ncbi:MAG: FAD-dependent oxidoreductase [Halobacteria archaeon]|nr:FAD-dependent oxidoreductase [Halobacteria archaeon]
MTKHVIIGDGIAGATAAETLRDESDSDEITVITNEGEPLYNRINIKEYAKGKMPEEHIKMHDEKWYEDRDIELKLNTLVRTIKNKEKKVVLHNGNEIEYDKLLVAAGGTPRSLPVPQSDADGIHEFWTFGNARQIRRVEERAESGIVIGAGLLGIDFAYALGENDVEGKYLMRGNRWWRYGLDKEGADMIHDELRSIGVEPVFGEGVERFETNRLGRVKRCVGTTGTVYSCDMAGVCIGLNLNTQIVRGTGIETNVGIVTDETLQTKDPDIYVAGDITEYYDVILQEYNVNGSWDSAKTQGQVAAMNMSNPDDPQEFKMVPKYSVSHFSIPFISLGHPTVGEEYASRKYGEKEYRRLAFKDGKLVGAVLIGNVRVIGQLTKVIQERMDAINLKEQLLEEQINLGSMLDLLRGQRQETPSRY